MPTSGQWLGNMTFLGLQNALDGKQNYSHLRFRHTALIQEGAVGVILKTTLGLQRNEPADGFRQWHLLCLPLAGAIKVASASFMGRAIPTLKRSKVTSAVALRLASKRDCRNVIGFSFLQSKANSPVPIRRAMSWIPHKAVPTFDDASPCCSNSNFTNFRKCPSTDVASDLEPDGIGLAFGQNPVLLSLKRFLTKSRGFRFPLLEDLFTIFPGL